jgi:CRP/FNR family transcriptional regulator, dissimilatory nitrate respiration regulator
MAISDWLAAAVRAEAVERRLQAGQTLFRQGNRAAGLYEIVGGKVRLARVDQSGREAVLHLAAAGDTIAEASLFSPTYHCDAIASSDALVRLYPKAAVLAEFVRDPKAAQAFMAMLARQVMSLRTRLEQRNIHSARDRVRHYLAVNAGADGKTVALPGTVKDLAGELGLTHEALYRTLSVMAAQGEIERGRSSIRLAKASQASI